MSSWSISLVYVLTASKKSFRRGDVFGPRWPNLKKNSVWTFPRIRSRKWRLIWRISITRRRRRKSGSVVTTSWPIFTFLDWRRHRPLRSSIGAPLPLSSKIIPTWSSCAMESTYFCPKYEWTYLVWMCMLVGTTLHKNLSKNIIRMIALGALC